MFFITRTVPTVEPPTSVAATVPATIFCVTDIVASFAATPVLAVAVELLTVDTELLSAVITEAEAVLAEKLLENICKVTEQQNRGVKKGFRDNAFGDYYINSDTDMPSLLLEVGFITNTGDNQVFDEKLDETAEAIAETIYSSIKK